MGRQDLASCHCGHLPPKGGWHLIGADGCSGVHCCLPAAGKEREAMPEAAAAVHPDHLHTAR